MVPEFLKFNPTVSLLKFYAILAYMAVYTINAKENKGSNNINSKVCTSAHCIIIIVFALNFYLLSYYG